MRSGWLLELLIGLQASAGQHAASPLSASGAALARGVEARQRGDLKAAISQFQNAVRDNSNNVDAHVDLGEALAADGQVDAAIAEDRQALEIAPDRHDARSNLGGAYYRKGDLTHARQELEQAHAAQPTDERTAILLGYTYNKLNRPQETVELLLPFEARHEANNELEYGLGYALIQTGRPDEGLPRLEKMAAATHSADAWLLAGVTRLNSVPSSDARPDLDAALKSNPALPGLYTLDAEAHYAMGDADAAIAGYRAALKANPMDLTANLDLGNILLDKGDLASAKPLLELAYQLDSRVPRARFEMAKVKEMSGDLEGAATLLEEIVKSEPRWLNPHWELSTIYFKLNRHEDSKREREIVKNLQAAQSGKSPNQ